MAGRPPKYEFWLSEAGLIAIMTWARAGFTDEDIAKKMGIATSTLYDWQLRFPLFSEAFQKNKEVADMLVVNAMYKRAIGYDVDEVTKEAYTDPKTGKRKMVVTKIVTKHIYPDVTAGFKWLYNRQPNEWRDSRNADSIAVKFDKDDPFTKSILDGEE